MAGPAGSGRAEIPAEPRGSPSPGMWMLKDTVTVLLFPAWQSTPVSKVVVDAVLLNPQVGDDKDDLL